MPRWKSRKEYMEWLSAKTKKKKETQKDTYRGTIEGLLERTRAQGQNERVRALQALLDERADCLRRNLRGTPTAAALVARMLVLIREPGSDCLWHAYSILEKLGGGIPLELRGNVLVTLVQLCDHQNADVLLVLEELRRGWGGFGSALGELSESQRAYAAETVLRAAAKGGFNSRTMEACAESAGMKVPETVTGIPFRSTSLAASKSCGRGRLLRME